MADTPDPNAGRDSRGRFAPGNPGGPGGSRRRRLELREAATSVVSKEAVAALMAKTTRRGLEGDLAAAKYVLDQCIGKPTAAGYDPVPLRVNLPNMKTAGDCTTAIDVVLRAFTAGEINTAEAQVLQELINTRIKALDSIAHEQQIAELERQVAQLTAHRN